MPKRDSVEKYVKLVDIQARFPAAVRENEPADRTRKSGGN